MKTLISLASVLLVSLGIQAQQYNLAPEEGVYGSLVPLAGSVVSANDYVVSGSVYTSDGYNHAIAYRLNSLGNILWSKSADQESEFQAQTIASNGDVLMAGTSNGRMLVQRLTVLGNILWTKVYDDDNPDDYSYVYAIVEDHDDDIVVVGSKRDNQNVSGSPEKEVIVKLGADGSLLWAKQLSALSGDPGAFKRVYIASDNTIDVFGAKGLASSLDIMVTKWATDGTLLCSKKIWSASSESLQDVAPYEGGYLLAHNQGASLVGLIKISSSLDLVPGGAKQYYLASGGTIGLTGGITVDGSSVLMSGWIIQSSPMRSFLARFDSLLEPAWLETVDTNSYATVRPLVTANGQVMTVSTSSYQAPPVFSNRIEMSAVEKNSGSTLLGFCEPSTVLALSSFLVSGFDQDDVARTVEPIDFPIVSTVTFSDYLFDNDQCLASAPLPIELVSFTAKAAGNEVSLEWVTASERENDYFTIERSRDGQNFEEVVRVDGAGNSTSLISYEEVDALPFTGQSYYRLRQTDYNGATTVSPIQAVSIEAVLVVYPNPIASGDVLHLPTEGVSYEIYNATGVLVKRIEGSTRLDGLPAGQYTIRLFSNPSVHTKIIVT